MTLQHDVRAMYDAERGVLDPRVFADEEIYRLEMEHLFTRSWLFLCPEGQIPDPGDFFTTYMGSDRVIVVRQKDGSVKALLNQCRHRSTELTREEFGNAKAFTCSYHGWTYDLAGNLRVVPFEEDCYRGQLDKSAWGVVEVPQLASYRGLLFGNWDPSAPSFEEYLGDGAWYLDIWCDRFDGGMELVGGVNKWVNKGNWKLGAEQLCWDSVHGQTSHVSAFMASVPADADFSQYDFASTGGRQFTSSLGHGCGMFGGAESDAPILELTVGSVPGQYWKHDALSQTTERLGATRAGIEAGHMTLFPNFSLFGGMGTIRVWHPTAVDEMELWSWVMVPANAPDRVKREWWTAAQSTFGIGGIYESDDGANWSSIQRTLKGAVARRTQLNMQMGLGQLWHDDPDYPGTVSRTLYNEGPARGFYQRWVDMLTLDTWSEIGESAKRREGAQL